MKKVFVLLLISAIFGVYADVVISGKDEVDQQTIKLIENAKQEIYVAFFYTGGDGDSINEFGEKLIEASKRGVKVVVISDYNPLGHADTGNVDYFSYSKVQKIFIDVIIIDNKIMLTGKREGEKRNYSIWEWYYDKAILLEDEKKADESRKEFLKLLKTAKKERMTRDIEFYSILFGFALLLVVTCVVPIVIGFKYKRKGPIRWVLLVLLSWIGLAIMFLLPDKKDLKENVKK